MQRRTLLAAGVLTPVAALSAELAPARATPDRIIDIAVCTRPFRAQGPRLEAERRWGKTLVHHYGHGGAGWSLSWGSALEALPLIRAGSEKRIAVIGCGAIGLTTARVAQQAGFRVRIYCKERLPQAASSAATGMWSPDSRICTSDALTPAFAAQWERMARASFRTWQGMLGVSGEPVEWRDGYVLSDRPFDEPAHGEPGEPDYPDLMERISDIRPRSVPLRPLDNPFDVPHARRFTQMVFNLASYRRMLVEDFLREGGEIEPHEFHEAREIAALKEKTVVNCTGYGARRLFGDESLIPVRGQTARLVPQKEIDYALIYRGHGLLMVPRRDGLLVQAPGEGDFGREATVPDRALTVDAVKRLAALYQA